MKFIIEIKNRFLLIILNCCVLFNVSYFYKNILLFFLIKQVAINQFIEFYLIYTNLPEFLNLYFEIVYLFTFNLTSYFILYHILIFVSYALSKTEFKMLNLLFFSFITINTILSMFVTIQLYALLWKFFLYFQKTFVFNLLNFEIKINEYYNAFLNLYIFFKYFTLFLIFNLIFFKSYMKIAILTKLRKTILIFLLFLLLTIINEINIQLF